MTDRLKRALDLAGIDPRVGAEARENFGARAGCGIFELTELWITLPGRTRG